MKDPHLHAWSEPDQPPQLLEKEVPNNEVEALACYGLWLPAQSGMLLRFVEGRPTSGVTVEYLDWVSEELGRIGKRPLLLVWDNAAWHMSREVRAWIKAHNRKVRQGSKEGVRLVVCHLPKRASWLNPIEPKWLHGSAPSPSPEKSRTQRS